MHAHEAIASRRSVRAFLPTPVPQETVEEILRIASRAPSGTNTQPWKVYVCAGAVKDALCAETRAARAADKDGSIHKAAYDYYPERFPEPYLARRRAVGWALYGLLGIEKGDREKAYRQHDRNFLLFDAPVGLFFFIDKRLELGSWLDYGMFIGNVMTAARGFGLHSCPQAAWPRFHKIVRKHLDVPETEALVCGMSLGYEDTSAIENSLRTERAPVAEFARFSGFN